MSHFKINKNKSEYYFYISILSGAHASTCTDVNCQVFECKEAKNQLNEDLKKDVCILIDNKFKTPILNKIDNDFVNHFPNCIGCNLENCIKLKKCKEHADICALGSNCSAYKLLEQIKSNDNNIAAVEAKSEPIATVGAKRAPIATVGVKRARIAAVCKTKPPKALKQAESKDKSSTAPKSKKKRDDTVSDEDTSSDFELDSDDDDDSDDESSRDRTTRSAARPKAKPKAENKTKRTAENEAKCRAELEAKRKKAMKLAETLEDRVEKKKFDWRTQDRIESLRTSMVDEIRDILAEFYEGSSLSFSQLENKAEQLELELFNNADNLEEYIDENTLEDRLANKLYSTETLEDQVVEEISKWRVHDDIDSIRDDMVNEIRDILIELNKNKSYSSGDELTNRAKQLEQKLFNNANSLEEYNDTDTLQSRVLNAKIASPIPKKPSTTSY